jgi:phosphoglycerate dehydrogenase-like enzyme
MRVIATRNSRREGPDFVEYVGLADEYRTLAARADVVVNATPLTSETRGMFDAQFFDALKRGAFFINIGRGESVVTEALVAALEAGKVGGAGLDVTDPEPLPPGHPLWGMRNVIITPHVATSSDVRSDRTLTLVVENLRRYMRGDALLSVVDLTLGY